jgi:hypothetical protein
MLCAGGEHKYVTKALDALPDREIVIGIGACLTDDRESNHGPVVAEKEVECRTHLTITRDI